jgi:hypothetical protein
MRNVSYKSYRENQDTYIMLSTLYSRNFYCLRDNVEKYGTAEQVTDDKIQGDQKISVHLIITIQNFTRNVQSGPHQSPDIQLNLPAWPLTARARGTLASHSRRLISLILTTLSW